MDRIHAFRAFYADLITANAGIPRTDSRLRAAFASTPRERFLGPGPWRCFTTTGYVDTPSDDPALLYQDITVAISIDPPINNGQPSLHALCLGALHVQPTDLAIHIGAGTGYYTAILAQLAGSVLAFEIDPGLAAKASAKPGGPRQCHRGCAIRNARAAPGMRLHLCERGIDRSARCLAGRAAARRQAAVSPDAGSGIWRHVAGDPCERRDLLRKIPGAG